MTISERIEHGKPYLTGFIFGLIAAPVIAFSAGWVSTTGARAEAVENARVETWAGVCSSSAARSWAEQSIQPASLKGWESREKRQELVAAALAGIQVPEPLVRKVAAGCERTLAAG